jgi:hypothetical protein
MVASLFTPAWVRRIEAQREISKAYFTGWRSGRQEAGANLVVTGTIFTGFSQERQAALPPGAVRTVEGLLLRERCCVERRIEPPRQQPRS